MSGGVVVVEAARRSGSLITAQIALDCGREVFAVPGHIDSRKSEGTHWLLKQGAKLVQGVGDIVEEMGGKVRRGDGGNIIAPRPAEAELEPDAARLLSLIDSYPQAREALLAASALTPARLNQLLLGLELDGHVELLAGDRVCKRAEKEQ
jgi:DNA processing protein